MNVPVHIYTNDELFENFDDGVINQAMNVSSLPGLVNKMSVMPDGHFENLFCTNKFNYICHRDHFVETIIESTTVIRVKDSMTVFWLKSFIK